MKFSAQASTDKKALEASAKKGSNGFSMSGLELSALELLCSQFELSLRDSILPYSLCFDDTNLYEYEATHFPFRDVVSIKGLNAFPNCPPSRVRIVYTYLKDTEEYCIEKYDFSA